MATNTVSSAELMRQAKEASERAILMLVESLDGKMETFRACNGAENELTEALAKINIVRQMDKEGTEALSRPSLDWLVSRLSIGVGSALKIEEFEPYSQSGR